jgi:serine/threonine protein phosphatase PrpC
MADEPFMGQTTAVCISVSPETVSGACVGDSEAWLVGSGQHTDLTAAKKRKPLLGSGHAVPVAFGAPFRDECVLVGSDGLCRFVKPDAVVAAAREANLDEAARDLVESVRLPSGELWDDATVVLCRNVARRQ